MATWIYARITQCQASDFIAIGPLRVGKRLQAHRRGAREGEHHTLAGRGVQAVLGGVAHAEQGGHRPEILFGREKRKGQGLYKRKGGSVKTLPYCPAFPVCPRDCRRGT